MQRVSLECVTIVTDTEEAVLVNSAYPSSGLDSLITVLERAWHGEPTCFSLLFALSTTSSSSRFSRLRQYSRVVVITVSTGLPCINLPQLYS